jgi:tRNA dimethylallyltransferase
MTGEAYFLVGPTASGKSAVAQHIAEQDSDFEILSADSMLVYRGMDIGTAKPSADEQRRVTYHGLDLQTPDLPFNAWAYRQYACPLFPQAAEKGKKIIVVGGSGLYIKSLTHGLTAGAGEDRERRQRWQILARKQGVDALQDELQEADPEGYEQLADKQNARRLVRALELAGSGMPAQRTWDGNRSSAPLCGLAFAAADLRERIATRVAAMYDAGLLDEVAHLREQYPQWSATAMQAIGYREALRHLAGVLSKEAAIQETVMRTRKFARRQRTWFRHQANVLWTDVRIDQPIDAVAERVLAQWKQHGPTVVV